ncbi:DUF2169 family type VI secretion system accessory protein [Azospirillum sp. ST 5-10]|uniref:DUF2169 family type VI secretion system accessory protein n=1 Tax=unclassified Azospirillum TaxID=2630922 RepID=UPI003F4A7237
MQTFNETRFAVATLPASIRAPDDAVAVIVKASVGLVPEGAARPLPAALQGAPGPDAPYPDGAAKSLRYPSDLVPFKPRADVIVVGQCWAPAGRTVTAAPVAVTVGGRSKRLAVFGDREWVLGDDGRLALSPPAPFERMPIRWETAFGGPDYLRNPFGKGRAEEMDAEGRLRFPLPNVEDPDNLIGHPDAEPVPVGFAALPATSLFRAQKQGTRDKAWARRRAPLPPADFDWSFHNAAPDDQQIDGYLRGDEVLVFEGMHPVLRPYRTQLPGLAVRCFADANERGDGLTALSMALDTLWVDVDAEEAVLVWRGLAPPQVAEGGLLVTAGPLAGPAPTLAEAAERMRTLRAADGVLMPGLDAVAEAALARARAALPALGLDPAAAAALARTSDPAAFAEALAGAVNAKLNPDGVTPPRR